MIPIYKDRFYAIDIEVKPLQQFDNNKYKQKVENENDEDECIDVDTPNFYPWCCEIYGISIAWGPDYETESIYLNTNIDKAISILSQEKLKLIAHNVFFDWSNLYYTFGLPLNFVADTGVVAQCINNSDFVVSFGLKQATQRLYNVQTQEKEIKEYLKHHYKIPESKYGAYIHLCPEEMVSKYCRLDAHYCWRIMHDGPRWLKSDISMYMKMYMAEVKFTIQQFLEGILVNQEGLDNAAEEILVETCKIEEEFFKNEQLTPFIQQVQFNKFNVKQSKLKKAKLDFDEWSKNPDNKFNINSTKQLKELFDLQKLHWDESKQKFIYPYVNNFPKSKRANPDSPKLGTKFLHAYGIGGEILADKGEKATLYQHLQRALEESELTGKIHPHINLLGTKTGRISGSGVNIIATPISDERYGKNLICEPGWSIVCRDVKSLEPTLLACFSGDPVLKYATFEGEGKQPFIKDDILWIDDIYIMAAYSAPFMRDELEDKLNLSNWLINSDGEKAKIKNLRNVSKTIVLATNYGAGALKIQNQIRENLKVTIPLKNIELFQDNYWATLSTAYLYKQKLEREVSQKGYFINIGGYPLTFYDRPNGIINGHHKALNKMLQSSAAVVMKLILYFLYEKIRNRTDIIPLVCDWHDAFFFKVRNETITEYRSLTDDVLKKVNETLNLPLRLDFNVGANFYGCK